jgi:hypothetical protein
MPSWKSYRIYLPFAGFLLLVIAYTIYWFILASEIETQINAARDQGLAGGGTLQFNKVSISGYPFLIIATFENARVEDPGAAFKADSLTATIRSYSLSHVIFEATGAQELTVMRLDNEGRLLPMSLSGTTKKTQASLILRDGLANRIDLVLNGFAGIARDIDGSARNLTATRLEIHLRENELAEGKRNVELATTIENAHMTPSDDLLLGPDINLIEVSTRLVDAPLETVRFAPVLRQWAEQGGRFELDKLLMVWGRVDLEAQGSFKLDSTRRLEGNVRSLLGGYNDLIDALVATDQLTPRDGSLAKQALSLLAMAARDKKGRVPVPVGFREGSLWLGPVRVAPLQPVM